MTNNDMLNENYKKACLNQTKRRLNDLLNKFLDDENIDSNYKSRIIDMIVGLLTLKQSWIFDFNLVKKGKNKIWERQV